MISPTDLKAALAAAKQAASAVHYPQWTQYFSKGTVVPQHLTDLYDDDIAKDVFAKFVAPLLARIAELEAERAEFKAYLIRQATPSRRTTTLDAIGISYSAETGKISIAKDGDR